MMMIAGQTPLAAPHNTQNYLIKRSISHIRAYTPSQVPARFPLQHHHKIVGYHYWIKQLTCVNTPDDFPLFWFTTGCAPWVKNRHDTQKYYGQTSYSSKILLKVRRCLCWGAASGVCPPIITTQFEQVRFRSDLENEDMFLKIFLLSSSSNYKLRSVNYP